MPFERREDESFDVVLEVARNDNNSQSSALKLSSKNRLISDYESGTSSSGTVHVSWSRSSFVFFLFVET